MAVPARVSTLVFLLLLVLSGGLVHAESSSGNTNESCLTRDETAQIIEKYTLYLTKYPGNRTVLEELLDENVTTASDSLSYVFQKPLNATLAHNLQEMLEQEAAVPAVPSVNTIFTSNTCDTITWYWEFTTKPYPTRGIVILFVNLQSRKIYKTYQEANIGAVLANQGSPECQIPDSNWKLEIGKEGLQREESSCEEVVHGYRDDYKP
ncbi:hypothetical protein CKM354_001203900 [Cercospora kikuchii]|uniref:NTF2-like domain-containing protein n=1 Tax=Cercospora kikuchii TaxID=84275 RepID=A0A9P3CU68_9PEZI|nr:uncharacterized protein CKM354_001203900 [Cercospora kikuchii]GIZ48998.1 hypothetical protein CKM354_001203900 [Cercospora kikuchii]